MFRRTQLAAITAAAMAGGYGPTAVAQTAPAAEPAAEQSKPAVQTLERVEVTGSRVKRAAGSEGPTAVETITRQDIERSGATTAAEVVRGLSAQAGASFDERNSSLANGTAAASLRGLAPNATLVLINGRRVSYNGFSSVLGVTAETFVDLNTLPVEAIDRVEILKDSASAIYGSDAVAGVINVILRRNYRGIETSIRHGQADGGADESGVTLTGGIGDLSSDRYNALLTVEFARRDYLFARDRNYAMAAGRRLASQLSAASLQNSPANAIGLAAPINNTANCPNGPLLGPSAQTVGSTLCGFNSNTQATLIPKQERAQLFGRFSYAFNNDLSLFAEAGYSDITTEYDLPSVGVSNLSLTAANPGNPFGQPILAFYRFVQLGPRRFTAENQSTRLLTGLQGRFGRHDWEIALGESKTDSTQTAGNLVRNTPWRAQVAAGTFNLFAPNSAAVLEGVRAEASREGESIVRFADFKLGGETPWRLAAPIGYALGGEYRNESQADAPSADLQSGQLLGFGLTNRPFSVDRDVGALFGELALPLLANLEAQVAVRSERYSDFGSSTNPKFGLKYQPVPQVALRASGGTSFRAPSLIEANFPRSSGVAGAVIDSTRCRALNIAFANCPLTLVSLALESDPAIGPEKGRNYSLGVVYSPAPQFNAAVDYVYIKYTDKIGLNLATVFPSDGGPVDERFVRRGAPAPGDPAGVPAPITDVTLQYANAFGQSIYRGFDFSFESRLGLGDSRVGLEFSGSYLDSFEQSSSRGGRLESQAGLLSYPRLRAGLSGTVQRGDWTGFVRLNYLSRQRDAFSQAGSTNVVGEDLTTDAQVQYAGFRNLRLALGAKNLFDRDPPESLQFSQGFNISTSSPRGRFIYVRVNYRFL